MATANFNLMKGEGVKYSQRGTFYTGSNGTGQYNIPLPAAVEVAKASVKLNGVIERMLDNSILPMGRISLNGTTNLLLDRAAIAISSQPGLAGAYIAWEVVEYANVTVLRGMAQGQPNISTTISSSLPTVDPARCQVNILGVTVESGATYSGGDCSIIPTLNANSIVFNTGGGASALKINWEIVIFN